MEKILSTIQGAVRKQPFLFLMAVLLMLPPQLHAQDAKKLTLTGGQITLLQAFESIEKQTGMSIVYNQSKLDVNQKTMADFKDQPLSTILDHLLENTGFTYETQGKYIVITAKEKKRAKEKLTVSGVVVDAEGTPVPGASILLKGTYNGAISDINGFFSFEVPEEEVTIVVSFMGYQSQELTAFAGRAFTVILKDDRQFLEEVVVVGYGTQKKVNLTGAVAAVSGDDMVRRPVTNAATMLQGMIPGLSVVQQSGQPGAEGTSFRVRGQGTYSSAGSDPLVLINGVPGSLSNLDPSIIENVSVLKDAASASIYGSRAANGVILVTTKKGSLSSVGNNSSVSYTGNFSIHTPTKMLNTVKSSAEYMELFNLAKKNSGKAGLYEDAEISKYRNPSDAYPSFDWVGFMFRPAFVQNHNLALSGSTDRHTYNIALNYANQPGTMRGFEYQKYNFATDLSSHFTSWMRVGAYVSANYSKQQQPRNGAGDAFLCTLAQAPTAKPVLADDGEGVRYTFVAYPNVEQSNKNMLAMIENGINTNYVSYDVNGQIYMDVTPFKGLKWHTKAAARLYDTKMKDWSGTKVPLYDYHTGEMLRYMDLGGGFIPGLQVSDSQTLYTNIYSFLEYKVPFQNDNHNLTLLAGYSQEMNSTDYLWAKRIDYQFNLHELEAGSEEKMENSGNRQQWSLMSGFFRLNYDYKGKYLFELNARYDGTSRIAKENRWGLFPSASLGWRLTEEAFVKDLNLDWLSNFKLRGSWGQLGNQNIGLYPYQAVVNLIGAYSFDNNTLTQGVAQTAYFNRDMKWETTTITDIGADITLLNKLNITFDWYNKKTTDILRTAQMSSFVGLSAPYINDGEMINKGFELAVNWNDNVRSGFLSGMHYYAGFYVDRSRNILSKFGADELGSTTILREGIPYNSYFLLDAIGIFADQAEIDNAPKQFSDNLKPGDIRYRDTNGDNKVDSDDRVVMNGNFPDFEYSFNAGLLYKGFDLSLFFQGVQGRSVYVGTGAGVVPFAQASIITNDYIKEMWTPENPYGAVNPKLYYEDMGGSRNRRASSYYLRDASYLRLKNLSLGYTFPRKWTRKAQIEQLRIFFSGDNLVTITGYQGLDPENGGYFLAYPQNKVYSFGINVEF